MTKIKLYKPQIFKILQHITTKPSLHETFRLPRFHPTSENKKNRSRLPFGEQYSFQEHGNHFISPTSTLNMLLHNLNPSFIQSFSPKITPPLFFLFKEEGHTRNQTNKPLHLELDPRYGTSKVVRKGCKAWAQPPGESPKPWSHTTTADSADEDSTWPNVKAFPKTMVFF